jgi:hypothetical protein
VDSDIPRRKSGESPLLTDGLLSNRNYYNTIFYICKGFLSFSFAPNLKIGENFPAGGGGCAPQNKNFHKIGKIFFLV